MARIRSIKPELWLRSKDAWSHAGECLYVISEVDSTFLKVGVAGHPVRRLSILQCGNPRLLELIAVFSGTRQDCRYTERAILNWFPLVRGEWISANVKSVLERIAILDLPS